MIRRIKRARQVRGDILAIYHYIYARSPSAADAVLDAIEGTIRGLARFPVVGNLWNIDDPRLSGLRYTHVSGYRNFVVFFRAVSRRVEIYRVVHGARDLIEIAASIRPLDDMP